MAGLLGQQDTSGTFLPAQQGPVYDEADSEYLGAQAAIALNADTPEKADQVKTLIKNEPNGLKQVRKQATTTFSGDLNAAKHAAFDYALQQGDRETALRLLRLGFEDPAPAALEQEVADKGIAHQLVTNSDMLDKRITALGESEDVAKMLILGNFFTEAAQGMSAYMDPSEEKLNEQRMQGLGESFDEIFTQRDPFSATEIPLDILKFAVRFGDATRIFNGQFYYDLMKSFINLPTAWAKSEEGGKGDIFLPGEALEDMKEKWMTLSPSELRKYLDSKKEEFNAMLGDNPIRLFTVVWDMLNVTSNINPTELQEQFDLFRKTPTLVIPQLDSEGNPVLGEDGNIVFEEIPNILHESYAQGGPEASDKLLQFLDYVSQSAGFQDVADNPLMDALFLLGIPVKVAKGISRLNAMVRVLGRTAAAQGILSQASRGVANSAEVYRHIVSLMNPGRIADPHLAAEVARIQRRVGKGLEDIPQAPRTDPLAEDIAKTVLSAERSENNFLDELVYATHETNEGNNYLAIFYRNSDGTGFANSKAARDWAFARGITDYEEVPMPDSNSIMVKIRTPLSDAGYYDGPPPQATWLDGIRQSLGLGKWVFTPNTTSTVEAAEEASAASLRSGQFQRLFQDLLKEIGSIGRKKGKRLQEMLNYSKQHEGRIDPNDRGVWLTETEFREAYFTKFGENPDYKEVKAYQVYREASDLAYVLTNKGIHDKAASLGVTKWMVQGENVEEAFLGKDIGRHAPQGEFLARLPDGTVTNSADRLADAMKDPDAFIIKLFGGTDYNRNTLSHVVVKRGNAKDVGLPRQLLNYKEGGSRVYVEPFFAKLRNKNRVITLRNFASKSEGLAWVAKMNTAQKEYKAFLKDLEALNKAGNTASAERALRAKYDNILQGIDPSLKTAFLDKKVADGMFDTSSPIELLYDRQKFAGQGESRALTDTNLVQSQGRLFYSHRGEFLRQGEKGDLSTLANPFEVLSYQIGHASRVAGFSDFSLKEMQSWAVRYAPYLTPESRQTSSLADIFLNGKFPVNPAGINLRQMWNAEAERLHIKTVLSHPDGVSSKLQVLRQRTAEGMASYFGDRTFLGKKYWEALRTGRVADENVINFMKGWAYDLHMGLFNLTHLWLQALGATAAVAMHPVHGTKSLMDTLIMYPMALVRMSDKGVDIADNWISKAGVYKRGEWKQLYNVWKKSGLENIRSTDTTLDNLSRVDGLRMGSMWQTLRASGRAFVYEGEKLARMTSFHIARRIADERVSSGVLVKNSDKYIKFIQGKSNALQLGMMSGMEAAWVRNPITALGFQMLQYPIKATETFLGLNRQLTHEEKFRFIAGQIAMWGAYGVPFGPQILEKYAESRKEPMTEEQFKVMLFGGMDAFMRTLFDEEGDTAFAAKLGYGDFHVSFVSKLTEHGVTGALGGIALGDWMKFKDIIPNVFYILAAYAFAEENEKISLGTATPAVIKEFADVIASANLGQRAYWLGVKGLLLDTSGSNILEINSKYSPLLQGIGVTSADEQINYLEIARNKSSAKTAAKISQKYAEKSLDAILSLSNGDLESARLHNSVAWLLYQSLPLEDRVRALRDAERNLSRDAETRARVKLNRLYKVNEEDSNGE